MWKCKFNNCIIYIFRAEIPKMSHHIIISRIIFCLSIYKGLIIPFKKESSRNLFSQIDILRLKYIHKLLIDDGLNIAGIRTLLALIPCWAIRQCSAKEREKCQAFLSTAYPCWEASEKGTLCKNTNCRECEVYGIAEKLPDLKSFFKAIMP